MLKQDKVASIDEIKERLDQYNVAIATRYIGINVAQDTQFRKKLRESGAVYRVYKNTLFKRALDEKGLGDAAEFLDGPTAWAFSNDPPATAKVIKEFAKEAPAIGMNGGILDARVLTAGDLEALAELPPREVLLSVVVGTIAAPLRNLVGTLNAVPRNMVNVVEAIRKKKEEEEAAA